jgi:hypothetical protein
MITLSNFQTHFTININNNKLQQIFMNELKKLLTIKNFIRKIK